MISQAMVELLVAISTTYNEFIKFYLLLQGRYAARFAVYLSARARNSQDEKCNSWIMSGRNKEVGCEKNFKELSYLFSSNT